MFNWEENLSVFHKIWLTILIFVLFYNPPIMGWRSLRLLAIYSLVYNILNINLVSKIVRFSRIKVAYITWIGIVGYVAIIGYLNDNSINYLAGHIYWIISVIPTCIVIYCMLKKNGYDIYTLLNCCLAAGVVQSILAIIAFISPNIKNQFISSMINGHVFEEETYTYEKLYRLFGYSSGLTFGMPVLQAFLTMLTIYLAVNYKKKYIVIAPFLAFSAIINARTSFVVFIVCAVVILIQRNGDDIKKLTRITALIVLGAVIVSVVLPFLSNNEDTLKWVNTGFDEIQRFLQGDVEQGYFLYLTNKQRWIFPEGIRWVFGVGARVMGNNKYHSATDIGIVNDMWLGGIVYVVLIYTLFLKYTKRIKEIGKRDSSLNGIGNYLFLSFLINAVLLNLKTYIIDIHSLSSLYILLLVCIEASEAERYINMPLKRKGRIKFGGI